MTSKARYQRARPVIINPGLYHPKKSGAFFLGTYQVRTASKEQVRAL
ncbi:hypothetical protein CCACVL1_03558 [Corchorus capsularis]|uniref:Uncharacterized protein n=1 Tax=Corchorus capsularis TaxID=210143 RepID=A0A1R3JYJ2_COCAP|nr:hypothetical protein CCACVL1_03558 [Corchorus capsularis]